MRFTLSQRLAAFGFDVRRDSFRAIRMRMPGTPSVVVSIEIPSDEEHYLRPRVLATLDREVDERLIEDLRMASRQLPAGRDGPPESWSLPDQPSARHAFSPPLRARLESTEQTLQHAALKAMGVVRWRIAELGPVSPFDHSRLLSWELDGHWYTVETDAGLRFGDSMPRVRFTRRYLRDIQAALTADQQEPLGHELLREAWGQRRERPRSALLIGVAALEVGVKEFVVEVAPDAEWLVEYAPTPPVVQMIWKYLPLLDSPRQFTPPGRHSRSQLEEAVRLRNRLAHAPSRQSVVPADVTAILRVIREVLWELDAARGFEWAAQYVTDPPSSPWDSL